MSRIIEKRDRVEKAYQKEMRTEVKTKEERRDIRGMTKDMSTHIWDPKTYMKSSSAQKIWADELLSKVSIRGDEKILDIGCGDGKITAGISRIVPRGLVVGLDNSPEMLSFARSRFPAEEWPNLQFQQGDARDLPYDNQFDLILSFAALHWVFDHRPVLTGIRRSLRRQGRVFMQFGGRGNAASVLDIAGDLISEEKWSRHFEGFSFPYAFYGPEEYRAWLDASGLRTLRLDLLQKDMVQKGRKELATWIESTWLPYIERIPEELRLD